MHEINPGGYIKFIIISITLNVSMVSLLQEGVKAKE